MAGAADSGRRAAKRRAVALLRPVRDHHRPGPHTADAVVRRAGAGVARRHLAAALGERVARRRASPAIRTIRRARSTWRPSASSSAAASFGSQQINASWQDLQSRCRLNRGGAAKQLRPVQPHDLSGRPSPADPSRLLQAHRHPRAGDRRPSRCGGEDQETPAQGQSRTLSVFACTPSCNADYACISFYMDIGQAWNRPHAAGPDPHWVSGGAFSCKP